jgi:hypothetical protein
MPSTLSESIYPQVVNSSRELEAFQPLPSDVLVPEYFQFPVFPVSVCVRSSPYLKEIPQWWSVSSLSVFRGGSKFGVG